MYSLIALLIAIVWMIIVYRTYGRYLDRKVIQADPKKTTPAVMYMDGVEFMPAKKNVLFGFQYKSICGIGPIAGAIFAVNWGWLPAMLYLLLGLVGQADLFGGRQTILLAVLTVHHHSGYNRT